MNHYNNLLIQNLMFLLDNNYGKEIWEEQLEL